MSREEPRARRPLRSSPALAGTDTVSLLLQADLTSEQIDLTLNAFVE